jgi:SsrA-binding protein
MVVRSTDKFVAQNRRARHDYFIDETVEAGVVLMGSEVKSLRGSHASIAESYAGEMKGEVWLFNAHIPTYKAASRENHEERRPRKLLLHRKERDKLLGSIKREGVTLVPLGIYFNERGIAKVEIGLARGKKKQDKRAAERDKDWQREKARTLRNKDLS